MSAFDLERFVAAQDTGRTFEMAVDELRRGLKATHWMWFVFPQLRGLGRSSMAGRYGISGLDEAAAYLAHPVLGQRLEECAIILLGLPGSDPVAVLGPIDATKLRSSMTLFARVPRAAACFGEVLNRFYGGVEDQATVAAISRR